MFSSVKAVFLVLLKGDVKSDADIWSEIGPGAGFSTDQMARVLLGVGPDAFRFQYDHIGRLPAANTFFLWWALGVDIIA